MKRTQSQSPRPVELVLARSAELFRAAGDIGRLRLLVELMVQERTVTELSQLVGLPMSTVSQQLRILRSAHLVKRRRVGKQIFYSLADDHVRELFDRAFAHAAHTPPGIAH